MGKGNNTHETTKEVTGITRLHPERNDAAERLRRRSHTEQSFRHGRHNYRNNRKHRPRSIHSR